MNRPAVNNSVTREPRSATIQAWQRTVRLLGGRVVPEICRSVEIGYELGAAHSIAYTCSCGEPAMAEVPFKGHDGQPHSATLCAVCDAATEMPRFA